MGTRTIRFFYCVKRKWVCVAWFQLRTIRQKGCNISNLSLYKYSYIYKLTFPQNHYSTIFNLLMATHLEITIQIPRVNFGIRRVRFERGFLLLLRTYKSNKKSHHVRISKDFEASMDERVNKSVSRFTQLIRTHIRVKVYI